MTFRLSTLGEYKFTNGGWFMETEHLTQDEAKALALTTANLAQLLFLQAGLPNSAKEINGIYKDLSI